MLVKTWRFTEKTAKGRKTLKEITWAPERVYVI
jgi:hypothetical protein